MFGPFDAALSGLRAFSTAAGVTGNNIANLQSVGRVGATSGPDQAYQAETVNNVTQSGGGGVSARPTLTQPATLLAYDPNSPLADAQGQVEAPNLDLATQVTDLSKASLAYRANISSLRTADDLFKQLLDIKG